MTVPDKPGLASYFAGLITAAIGAATLQDVAVFIGILATVATFAINLYYQRRRTFEQVRADKAKARHYGGYDDDRH